MKRPSKTWLKAGLVLLLVALVLSILFIEPGSSSRKLIILPANSVTLSEHSFASLVSGTSSQRFRRYLKLRMEDLQGHRSATPLNAHMTLVSMVIAYRTLDCADDEVLVPPDFILPTSTQCLLNATNPMTHAEMKLKLEEAFCENGVVAVRDGRKLTFVMAKWVTPHSESAREALRSIPN